MENEKIVELIRQGKDRKKYEALLYEKNYGLIKKIAWKFRGYADPEDLRQEAYFALRQAVDHYDPAGGARFATYASYWILEVMQRYVDDNGTTIRLPSYQRTNIIKYARCCDLFEKLLNRRPTDTEAAAYLKMSAEQIEEIRKARVLINTRSLYEVVGGDDDDLTLEGTIPAEEDYITNLIETMSREEAREGVQRCVQKLSGPEATVLRGRFFQGRTLQELGQDLHVSTERVRQIEKAALKKVRQEVTAKRNRDLFEEYVATRERSISASGGLSAFKISFTSSVEAAAMFREAQEARYTQDRAEGFLRRF